MGHLLTENRNSLAGGATVTEAGTAFEWLAALALLERLPGKRRKMMGADKGYDVSTFVAPCQQLNITAHAASRCKGTTLDGRTRRHAGYAISRRIRKRIEEAIGWGKLTSVSLPRERFWDIPVPKIDSPTRQPLVPRPPCVRAATPHPCFARCWLRSTPAMAGRDGRTATLFPLRRFATPGKQCALIATGDYRPSLRSPWPAASVPCVRPVRGAAKSMIC